VHVTEITEQIIEKEVPVTVQVTSVVEVEKEVPVTVTPIVDLGDLHSELEAVRVEIAAAEEKDSMFSGGLIKSLIAVRIEILKTTEALLEQRTQALESGAKLTVEVKASEPDPNRASALAEEIAVQREELKAAGADAAQYSGGLVQAMKLTTVATQEQTLAMLEQEYLIAKYGLGFPVIKPPIPEQEEIPQVGQAKTLEVVDVDARITESNPTWEKFAWKLTVKNLTSSSVGFDAIIEFLDDDGFVVDDAREYGLLLGPEEEQTFTGYILIDASVSNNVSQIQGKVRAK